uniref:Uncharacterized protein n=1 Tax=Panagrolaimus superbus TaxID=310955 RepID=A0A914Z5H1_9BILA
MHLITRRLFSSSALSLIPEQHSIIDEDTEHSVMESESDISSKKSLDSKRIIIDHSINIQQKSIDEKSQTKASSSSTIPAAATGGSSSSTGSGIANKISNFLVRRKSNASNS